MTQNDRGRRGPDRHHDRDNCDAGCVGGGLSPLDARAEHQTTATGATVIATAATLTCQERVNMGMTGNPWHDNDCNRHESSSQHGLASAKEKMDNDNGGGEVWLARNADMKGTEGTTLSPLFLEEARHVSNRNSNCASTKALSQANGFCFHCNVESKLFWPVVSNWCPECLVSLVQVPRQEEERGPQGR
jgi:hypothetical protein